MNSSTLATQILFHREILPDVPAGGKATALADLIRHGFPVPPFFVLLGQDAATGPNAIRQACRTLDPSGARFAVRSSAIGEDSASHSFAGQFDSFLRVPLAAVPDRCLDVIASAENERVATYRTEAEIDPLPAQVSVIVQKMIDADLAGVAFTADPVTGDRKTTVISATSGTAENLVSGTVDGETFRVARDGTVSSPGSPETLTKQQAESVAGLARRAESHFGSPQDIEWAIADGEIFLLQSRPITNLKKAQTGRLRIWDNSNIAESYSGITSPLTFSFASRAYASVYRQFCKIMGVPRQRIDGSAEVFDNMLGHIRGHVFYNLVNWYHVLALLPGFRTNRKFMEQMMGVKVPMPDEIIDAVEGANSVGKFRDATHIARTLAGLGFNLARHRRAVRKFHRRLDEALAPTPIPLGAMSAPELVAHYHDLEEKLLRRWDTPLVNDFFAMIFFGLLKKKAEAWLGDADGSIANELIRDTGASTSLDPPRRVREMAGLASADGPLLAALESATTAEELADFPIFHGALTSYLSAYGDRCLSELKLESATLTDDASPLLQTIRALAQTDLPNPEPQPGPKRPVDDVIGDLPFFRKRLFRWILKSARDRLRDREQLRYERTRVFGRVRNIMRLLGKHFAAAGKLKTGDDIFYLTVEEAIGETPFTPDDPAARRAKFKSWESSTPPPDRFETRGENLDAPPPIADRHPLPKDASSHLVGVGASPGTATGVARVITDPRGAHIKPGEIIVARQTDPGWVVLFPAAAAIVVERGSLLSHSAIVAREMGIPAVVSLTGATSAIPDGTLIKIDGTTGEISLPPSEELSKTP